eukprot:8243896-Lingulodinium_polyedra.AAC.1
MYPEQLTSQNLTAIRKKDRRGLHRLACFIIGEDEKTSVWEHDGLKFREQVWERAKFLKHRLRLLPISKDGSINWSVEGCYTIVLIDGKQHIKHISGETAWNS